MQHSDPIKLTLTSDDLLTIPDAACLLHIHRVTLYRWIRKGKIGHVTIATVIFIPKSEIGRLQHGTDMDTNLL